MTELKLVIVTPNDFFNHPQWRLLMSIASGQSQSLTDLQTAVTALATEGTDIAALVTSLDQQLEALLSATSNPDDAQVEAAAQAIGGTIASLQGLITSQPGNVVPGAVTGAGAPIAGSSNSGGQGAGATAAAAQTAHANPTAHT